MIRLSRRKDVEPGSEKTGEEGRPEGTAPDWVRWVRSGVQRFLHELEVVIDPNLCVVCQQWLPVERSRARLCESCLHRSFEPSLRHLGLLRAEPLPRDVLFRTAVWEVRGRDLLHMLVHRMKYEEDPELALQFGRVLGDLLRIEAAEYGFSERFDPCLIPVPLHAKRLRARGYNQARLLADGVAEVTGWSVVPEGAVVRIRDTPSQTSLERPQRRVNLEGVFDAPTLSLLPWECPILVDDLWTTGSTLLELARTVRKSGVSRMVLATLAEVV
ncbi:MAG: ComF family protein [Bacteroidota bacterium]